MNAKEFDIEKLIKDDVKSIEIDQDFKARLKANIMKNDTSSTEKIVSLKDAKDKRVQSEDNHKKTNVKRYLKIASSFAIVGIFGVQFALNGLPGAIARSNQKIESANKLVVSGSHVYNINGLKVNNGNGEEVYTEEGKKDDIKEGNIEGKKVDDSTNTTEETNQQSQPEKNVDTENPKTNETSDAGENTGNNETQTGTTPAKGADDQSDSDGEVKENVPADGESEGTETPVETAEEKPDNNEVAAEGDDVGLGDSKAIIDSEIDDDLIKNSEKVSLSANVNGGVVDVDILDDKILLDYGKQTGIQFYFGKLTNLKESKFDVRENTISMKVNENSNEMIYNAKDGKKVVGIKSVGDNLIAVTGDGSDKYDLIKIDIKSKEAKEMHVDCENLIFNNDFSYAAFEKNGTVKIVDLHSGEVVSRVGHSIAWSPDGEFVSYLRSEVAENEEGKKQTTSIIAAYNIIDKTETKVLKSELIDKSENEVMSRYNYGKHLWEKTGKCIYLIREDMKIITENDLEKIIVKKIIFE